VQPRWKCEDEKLVAALQSQFARIADGTTLLVVPLAVGGHVDHLIVHEACKRAAAKKNVWYADLPYSLDLEPSILTSKGFHETGAMSCTESDLQLWSRAIRCYRSQQLMLQHDDRPVFERIIRHHQAGRTLKLYTKLPASTEAADTSRTNLKCVAFAGK
jgi:LmbE family N-acetylglucosaminyl deacetylase